MALIRDMLRAVVAHWTFTDFDSPAYWERFDRKTKALEWCHRRHQLLRSLGARRV